MVGWSEGQRLVDWASDHPVIGSTAGADSFADAGRLLHLYTDCNLLRRGAPAGDIELE